MTTTMLKVSGLKVAYGGIQAVKGIDLDIQDGELVTLIGANGAGKSTLVKTISGLIGVRAGTITFDGKRIDAASTAARMRLGIAHVPEGRQIFSGLSVAENLGLGAYVHRQHFNENQQHVQYNRTEQNEGEEIAQISARVERPAKQS